MRRLLLVLPVLALVGCKEAAPPEGAVKVTVSYTGFLPGCVLVVARDEASGEEQSTSVPGKGTRTSGGSVVVGVFPKASWGDALRVEARAFEQACEGTPVVTRSGSVAVTKGQVSEVPLALAATDSDQDGYVSVLTGGTDCKDLLPAIHPGAEELCNDTDDDCDGDVDDDLRLGESCTGEGGCEGTRVCGPSGAVLCNSPAPQLAYRDQDGDRHGLKDAAAQPFCGTIPSGYVAAATSQNDDCDDTRGTVYPGATELCDDLDNDCSGGKDERFALDTSCDPTSGCGGLWKCDPSTLDRACVAQQPTKPTWYQDDDGDGYGEGGDTVQACQQPAHYAAQGGDCNDGNPFTNPGATELCDNEDNDCNGQPEAVASCPAGSRDWVSTTVGGNTGRTWYGISLWGDHGVWVVGSSSGRAVKKPGAPGFAELTSSCGVDWYTVWADPNGTAYMGGTQSAVVSQTPDSTTCVPQKGQDTDADVNGLWGIPISGSAQLFGVGDTSDADGFLFTWDGSSSTATPTLADNLPLFEVQGLPTGPLFAVGGGSGAPAIYRYDFMLAQWVKQSGIPDTASIDNLYAVSVVNDRLAFAGGDNGAFLRWNGSTWTADNYTFSGERITGIEAFGSASIYVVTLAGKVYRYNGATWSMLRNLTGELRFIRGTSPEDLWVVGNNARVIHWPK